MIIGPFQGRVFWLPFSIFIHYLLLISNPQGGQSRSKSTLARLTRPIVSVLSTSSAPRWLRFKKAGKGLNFHKYLWIESETQGNVKVHLWPSFDFQLLCLKVRDRLLNAHNSLGPSTRVRRDPGTRPVPDFFSSTQSVPTRKLKMTGYWVIEFHIESNETQPRMKRTANKVKDPINSSTGNHFFIYWGKWTRTDAVISSQCLRPIDLRSLRLHLTIAHSSNLSGLRFALFGVTVCPAA